MSKRLILILAIALAVGFSAAAYAEVQNVKVSGDISVIGLSRNLTLGSKTSDGLTNGLDDNMSRENQVVSIARVKVDADLTDNVATTVRLLNERYWGTESQLNNANGHNSDISLDLAYVTLKEFLYSPLTLTVGRQELHFGNDMIIGDVDTNNVADSASPLSMTNGSASNPRDPDLSARKSFDAIRATLNYDPLVIDALWSRIDNAGTTGVNNDNIDLYGINAGYDLGRKNTKVEAYYFGKVQGKKRNLSTTAAVKKVDAVHTIGGRVVTQPIENLTYQLEAAYQFGKRVRTSADATVPSAATTNQVERKAWALETSLSYNWRKVKYTPSGTLLYGYFSGDHENNVVDANRGAWRGWDPMYENQKFGDIANALFNQTNIHVAGALASMKPVDDVTLKGEYYMYWWAKAFPETTTGAAVNNAQITTVRGTKLDVTQRRFVGSELDLTATYDYTEDVQFNLMGGWFFPGSTFKKTNSAKATEVIGSMKVTF